MSTPARQWRWIEVRLIHAVHEEQLVEHGGGAGLRDANMLESALALPQQRAHYGDPDVADLAASYGYGLERNHPFVDGNKRTAFVAVELFLALNGYDLHAADLDCVLNMPELAAGNLPEAEFAAWIRSNIQPR